MSLTASQAAPTRPLARPACANGVLRPVERGAPTVRRTVRRRDRPSVAHPCACPVPGRRPAVPYGHDGRNHPDGQNERDDRRARARRTAARARPAALRVAAAAQRRRPTTRRRPRAGDPGPRLAASEALRADDFDSVRPWLLTVARRLAIERAGPGRRGPRRSATPCWRTRGSVPITPNGRGGPGCARGCEDTSLRSTVKSWCWCTSRGRVWRKTRQPWSIRPVP